MNVNRPLFWHQGLFLQPHHFQQQDLYFQSLLAPYQRFIQPYLWGVGDLEIQESALDNGSFHLNRGEFLFSDRSYVTFPGNAVIEARSFDEAWFEGEKPLMVYLGIRKLNHNGENVTVMPSLSRSNCCDLIFPDSGEASFSLKACSGCFTSRSRLSALILKD